MCVCGGVFCVCVCVCVCLCVCVCVCVCCHPVPCLPRHCSVGGNVYVVYERARVGFNSLALRHTAHLLDRCAVAASELNIPFWGFGKLNAWELGLLLGL